MSKNTAEDSELTIRQEKFAHEFILTGVASEAYRRAYPRSLKWKETSVQCEASKLLANPNVSQRVEELREELKEKFDISAERLLIEQARIALFDFRKLWDSNGRLIDPLNMPAEVAAAISSLKVSRVRRGDDDAQEEIVELKLWNKNSALESLFKNHGLYEKDNRQRDASRTMDDFTTEQLLALIHGGIFPMKHK
jgi:phage terminase small subunit